MPIDLMYGDPTNYAETLLTSQVVYYTIPVGCRSSAMTSIPKVMSHKLL